MLIPAHDFSCGSLETAFGFVVERISSGRPRTACQPQQLPSNFCNILASGGDALDSAISSSVAQLLHFIKGCMSVYMESAKRKGN